MGALTVPPADSSTVTLVAVTRTVSACPSLSTSPGAAGAAAAAVVGSGDADGDAGAGLGESGAVVGACVVAVRGAPDELLQAATSNNGTRNGACFTDAPSRVGA
jgi:hypothetical protein